MSDINKKLLDDEIQEEIKHLSELEPGTKEHADAVESLERLYQLRTNENKVEFDYYNQMNNHEEEMRLKEKELKLKERELDQADRESERNGKHYWFDYGSNIGKFTIDAGIVVVLAVAGLKFEETGTFTSLLSRNMFSGRLPKLFG